VSTLEDDIKLLREEFGKLRGDLSKITDTLENTVKNGSAEAVHLARGAVDELKHDASKAANGVSKTIESAPLNSAIVALGAGVVLGLLLSPKR
jgi:ElaB/YqjD/DUF883 family membrane-anchored ribosome-binding protein